jgi:ABC-type bacteriocin/lantibiotic exporter with double-glycine peptidase domain
VVLFWGALRLFHSSGASTLTAGTFIAFHAAFGLFIAGATSLSNALIDLLEVTTLWERVRPIVVTSSEVNTGKVDPGRLTGKVALEDVTFRYQEHGPIILDKVSLHAEPGEFIALVGSSGSGKSTIFRLLLGFETPQAGAVSYENQELSRLDVVAVRRQLGAVLQQSTIMAATIFENIAGGALITQQEAWEALHAAGLAEDIAAMPMGLHTFVSEGGSNLSGGQRQCLLIARALVRQPALVLFDEATSALDNRTQAVAIASRGDCPPSEHDPACGPHLRAGGGAGGATGDVCGSHPTGRTLCAAYGATGRAWRAPRTLCAEVEHTMTLPCAVSEPGKF